MSAPIGFEFQVRGDAEAKSKIQGVGGAFQNLNQSASSAITPVQAVERNYSQAALGLSAAATSVFSLGVQFDNLGKIETRIASAEKEVDSARATLLTNQTALNKLVADGTITGERYEAAQLRVSTAQQQLAIAQQRVGQATGDLTQAQLQLGLNALPAVFATVTGFTSAMKALGITMDLTRVKTLLTGPPMLTLAGTLGGTSAAATGTAGSFGVLRTAMNFIAAHPIILPLTALATVLTLVATNAFGLRDALDSFGKKVEEVFPAIKPVFDFFRWVAATLFPDAAKEASALQTQYDTQFASMATIVQSSTGDQNLALNGLSSQFEMTQSAGSNAMATLASSVSVQADNIVASANRARDAMASIGAAPAVLTPSGANTANTFSTALSALNMPSSSLVSSLTIPQQNTVSAFTNLLRKGSSATNVDIKVFLDSQQIAARVSKKTTDGILGIM